MTAFLVFFVLLSESVASFHFSNTTGFAISRGFQSPKLAASTIGDITSQLNEIRHYRFYGWSDDAEIAWNILSKASHPQTISFYIALKSEEIHSLTTSTVDQLLSKWQRMSANIYAIALSNEPTRNDVDLSILANKLTLTHQHLQTLPKWQHVRLFIPFSGFIFSHMYPVSQSAFVEEYKTDLKQIVHNLHKYNGFFGINVYPFWVLKHESNLINYCLGTEGDGVGFYDTMTEAQYDATHYAIQNITNLTVEVAITEAGWPSAGKKYDYASLSNAETYIQSTLESINNPFSILYGVKLFLFELFDENKKAEYDCEQHWGFYDISGDAKYDMVDVHTTTWSEVTEVTDSTHKQASNVSTTRVKEHDVFAILGIIFIAVMATMLCVCFGVLLFWKMRKRVWHNAPSEQMPQNSNIEEVTRSHYSHVTQLTKRLVPDDKNVSLQMVNVEKYESHEESTTKTTGPTFPTIDAPQMHAGSDIQEAAIRIDLPPEKK